jgi:hypothetical protein
MTQLLLGLALATRAEASTLYLVDTFGDLTAVDLTTRQATPIGPVGVPFDQGALSWDASTSTMWMLPGRAGGGLYTLDLQTGAATWIADHGLVDAFASAASGGALYALQGDALSGLWRVDTVTGAASFVGSPVLPFHNGFAGVGGADFDVAGRIIANASQSAHLYAIDPATAAATYLGNAGVGVTESGLAVDPDTGLIYLTDAGLGRVYEVDPSAGYSAALIYAGNGPVAAAVVPDLATNLLASTSGVCPGRVALQVFGATPGENVAFVYSRAGAGVSLVPAGPCQGLRLPLLRPQLGGIVRADALGEARVSTLFNGGACSLEWFAVDLGSCSVSNVASP